MGRSLSRAAAALIAIAAVAACRIFNPAYSAHVTANELNTLLPVVQELRIESYVSFTGDSEYIKYSQGAFATKPEDDFCRVSPGGRDDDNWAPHLLDDQAQADLERLHREFEMRRARFPGAMLNVSYDATGSILRESEFAFAPCDVYVYSPGWTALPSPADFVGDVVASGIDPNWYNLAGC
jgi:hypothetical protein